MTYLFDVNLLIALLDRAHVHHDLAQTWFASLESAWATCPLTELGVVRILSGSGYRNAVSTREALRLLEQLCALSGHEFWPDDVSLLDTLTFQHEEFQRSHEVTDGYLIGLAAVKDGVLASLDRKMNTSLVHLGKQAYLLIEP